MKTSWLAVCASLFCGTLCADIEDLLVDMSAGDQTVNVEAGQTKRLVITIPGVNYSITKTGAGTLCLTNNNFAASYSNLVVQGGLARVDAENNFGGGTVTLSGGGGLAIASAITLARAKITFAPAGSGTVYVQDGVTFTVTQAYFITANSDVLKQGPGTLFTKGAFQTSALSANGTWIADEGTWKIDSYQLFTTGTGDAVTKTIEVHEGALFNASYTPTVSYRNAFGNLVLRGGTFYCGNSNTTGSDVTAEATSYGFIYLNGVVTALPSSDGSPSVLRGKNLPLSQLVSKTSDGTVFDVQDGATLEIDGSFGDDTYPGTLKKTGAGTLRILKTMRNTGRFNHLAGIVSLAPGVAFEEAMTLSVADGAVFRLEDRAVLEAAANGGDALIASANVWFDATKVTASNIRAVPNLGRDGGAFRFKDSFMRMYGYQASVPTLLPNAINGNQVVVLSKTGYYFDYVNTTNEMTVFVVARSTGWGTGPNEGHNAAAFSVAPSGGSDTAAGNFHYEYSAADVLDLFASGSDAGSKVSVASKAGTDFMPYLDTITRTADGMTLCQYWSEAEGPLTAAKEMALPTLNVGFLTIGARATGGLVDFCGTSDGRGKVYAGHLGELIIFNRALSTDEKAYIQAYLKNKWFGTSITAPPLASSGVVNSQIVDVQTSDTGTVVAKAGAAGSVNGLEITKTGAGAMLFASDGLGDSKLDVMEGKAIFGDGRTPTTAAIWLDAADADSLTMDDGGMTIASVANKGHAGGSFLPYAPAGANHPTVGAISNASGTVWNPSVKFDGNDTLRLTSFSFTGDDRTMYAYLVKSRDTLSAYSQPFTFTSLDEIDLKNGESIAGSLTATEESASKMILSFGVGGSIANVVIPDNGIGNILLFHVNQNHCIYEVLLESTAYTNNTYANRGFTAADPAANINCWQLGARLPKGGVPDRFWKGQIGEMIVFTHPLNKSDERDLLDYLNKKWFGTGGGSATPPDFMQGYDGTVNGNGKLAFAMADGTELEHGQGTVALKAFTAEGAVSVTRTGPTSSALFTIADDLAFNAAAVTLSLDPFPEESTVLMTYGGSFLADEPVWTLLGEGADFAKVRHNTDGKSIILSIQSGSVLFIK